MRLIKDQMSGASRLDVSAEMLVFTFGMDIARQTFFGLVVRTLSAPAWIYVPILGLYSYNLFCSGICFTAKLQGLSHAFEDIGDEDLGLSWREARLCLIIPGC
eukprot:5582270-Pleurochrysis_carterae.AAC.1